MLNWSIGFTEKHEQFRNCKLKARLTVHCVVCDEVKDVLDVIEGDFISKRQEDGSFFLLGENFLFVLWEEVIIFTEADREEVKEISNIDIVSERAEVSSELSVEIQHVLQVARSSNPLNIGVEYFYFLGQDLDQSLGLHNHSILPDPGGLEHR